MKITWEESDIFAGRRLQKPDCGISGSWMVSYVPGTSENVYSIVSLADGLILRCGEGRKCDVVAHLNGCKYLHPAELHLKQWMREGT
jgi:hypothetical protein